MSVKETAVIALALLLLSVTVRCDVPPVVIDGGENDFVAVGGAVTGTLATVTSSVEV